MAMHNFLANFKREGDGSWLCVSPAELLLESGRIQVAPGSRFTRGTRFMGVDLAELLDAQYRNDWAR
jgi:hypothetical protein